MLIIYKATNLINGKVYIGQTIGTLKYRQTQHLWGAKSGSNYHFHNALLKYGVDNFKWEVLCCCFAIDGLNEMEVYFIALYDSMKNGYNLQSGGLNYRASEETKAKMSNNNARAMLGRKVPEETKEKMRIAKQKMSKETKRKLGKAISEAQRGEKNHNYGKHPSEETKKKISDSQLKYWLGKKHSKEQNSKQGF